MFKDKSPFNVADFNVYQPMAGNVVSKAPWWLNAINPFLIVAKLLSCMLCFMLCLFIKAV